MQRMKWTLVLHLYKKVNSKWIKDFNIRPRTIKLPGENIGASSLTLVLTIIFLDLTLNVKATNAIIKKRDDIKPNSFFTAKEMINKIKIKPMELTSRG